MNARRRLRPSLRPSLPPTPAAGPAPLRASPRIKARATFLAASLAAVLGTVTLASCAQTAPPPTKPAGAARPAEPGSQRLARELRTAIGRAACTADSQCRTVPVGAKSCGGPAGYWAWSTEGTDAKRVAEAARQQAEAQRRENEASGLLSDCRVVTDPGARCVAGRCELATTSATAGAAAR